MFSDDRKLNLNFIMMKYLKILTIGMPYVYSKRADQQNIDFR